MQSLSTNEWDPQGQYKEVIQVVEKAGEGQVKVFRVEMSGARVEYWVLSTKDGRVVGVRAKAVES